MKIIALVIFSLTLVGCGGGGGGGSSSSGSQGTNTPVTDDRFTPSKEFPELAAIAGVYEVNYLGKRTFTIYPNGEIENGFQAVAVGAIIPQTVYKIHRYDGNFYFGPATFEIYSNAFLTIPKNFKEDLEKKGSAKILFWNSYFTVTYPTSNG